MARGNAEENNKFNLKEMAIAFLDCIRLANYPMIQRNQDITWKMIETILLQFGCPPEHCSQSKINDVFKRSKNRRVPPRIMGKVIRNAVDVFTTERNRKFLLNKRNNISPLTVLIVITVLLLFSLLAYIVSINFH